MLGYVAHSLPLDRFYLKNSPGPHDLIKSNRSITFEEEMDRERLSTGEEIWAVGSIGKRIARVDACPRVCYVAHGIDHTADVAVHVAKVSLFLFLS